MTSPYFLFEPRRWLLLSLLVLAACGSPHLPTQAPLAQAPTVTLLPTAEDPLPTETSLATVTPTATEIATSGPEATATATLPPSATPCAARGEVITSTFTSRLSGSEHAYRIYLPPCYGQDGRAFPTLYLLAGNIHDEGKWDELGMDEAADEAFRAGESPPVVIVMPHGGWLANNTSGGPGSYEMLVLEELMPHVEGEYCVWAEAAGRAIGGLSRGGYWALEIGFRHPQLFVSVGGHSAALLDQYAGPQINPQVTGVNNELGDLRVYLDIGASDYLRSNTIKLHEELLAAGVAHTWHLNEGRHEDAYWEAHVADYLAWYSEPWPLDRDAYPPCP